MFFRSFVFLLACLSGCGMVHAQNKTPVSRGELLYSTHCIACHDTQLHWRERKLATDWTHLKAEVNRWQKTTGLQWRDDDVTEVARYLNTRYYHFSAPALSRSKTGNATQLSKQQE